MWPWEGNLASSVGFPASLSRAVLRFLNVKYWVTKVRRGEGVAKTAAEVHGPGLWTV